MGQLFTAPFWIHHKVDMVQQTNAIFKKVSLAMTCVIQAAVEILHDVEVEFAIEFDDGTINWCWKTGNGHIIIWIVETTPFS